MWYEIVPTFLIITASIALPCFAAGGLHKFFTGNVRNENEISILYNSNLL